VMSAVSEVRRVPGAHVDLCDFEVSHLASFGLSVEAKGRVPS
jgi:hypothetical protein